MRKLIVIIVLLILPALYACLNPNCVGPPYFQVKGLLIDNIREEGNRYYEAYNGDTIDLDDFHFRVEFEVNFVSSISNGNLMADCLHPGENGIKGDIGVDTLYLITLNDYNQNLKSNDTINSILTFRFNYAKPIQPFEEYFEAYEDKIYSPVLLLYLNESPIFLTRQKFKIVFILDNGDSFTAQSNEVVFR